MPILKSAKKKKKQDIKRGKINAIYKAKYKEIVVDLKRKKSKKVKISENDVKKAYKVIDKATKKKVIHKNKANRIKSFVMKLK